MAGRSKFNPSISGIGELLHSAMVAEVLVAEAEAGKAYAESIAPKRTGHYSESFFVTATRSGGARKHDRAAAYISNDDRAAIAIEFGTKNTPAHRTLGRTLAVMRGD